MACGIPVVASPVGVNTEIVGRSCAGLLADSLLGWETALSRLLDWSEERSRLGANGRRAVEETYSLASELPGLMDAIGAVVSRKRG